MMRDISSACKVCYCFLGQETGQAGLALAYALHSLLEDRREFFLKTVNLNQVIGDRGSAESLTNIIRDGFTYRDGVKAFVELVNRRYFTCLWVMQEVADRG